jgi:hypothetical protein
MKCIKNKADGTIKRVTDEVAFTTVGSKWDYVSKSEWKQTNRVVEPVKGGEAIATAAEVTVTVTRKKKEKNKK